MACLVRGKAEVVAPHFFAGLATSGRPKAGRDTSNQSDRRTAGPAKQGGAPCPEAGLKEASAGSGGVESLVPEIAGF